MSTPSRQSAVMIDGSLVPADAPLTVLLDDGLVRGDGVFEGMRIYDRRPRTPAAHLDRLALSAVNVDLSVDVKLLRAELATFCQATVSPDCGVRLMVTRGGQRIWREEPLPPARESIGLMPAPHRVTPLLMGAKTLSYAANMQALRRAKAAGMDDALFVRADDDVVLEGPVTAFAWIEGDTLVFPPLSAGVLDSITRRIAREALPTAEREAPLAELASADGAMLMSTVIECVPVHEIAGVARFDATSRTVRGVCDALRDAISARTEEA